MSGALLQLASMGPQDVYITGNPEITLFKKVYLRYTNFSLETVQQPFDNNVDFGTNSTMIIEPTGDLISKIVLVLTLENITSSVNWGYVKNIGHAIIEKISVTIDGNEIDSHYNDWINIYNNLHINKSHQERYKLMIGDTYELKNLSTEHPSYTLYIPLEFWFCKSSSNSFPVCSLNNKTFQISVTLKNAIDCINYKTSAIPLNTDLPKISAGYILVDYVYLETNEKKLFQTNTNEYMIEQLQTQTNIVTSANSFKTSLTFDNPCKYLIWCVNLDKYFYRNNYLVWAPDDNWSYQRDQFAKIVWLATRNGLNVSDITNPYILFENTFVNIGQEPNMIIGGNSILERFANKVNCIILFAEKDDSGNIIAKATLDNVILIMNNITSEDMSTIVDDILLDTKTTTDQSAFLSIYSISIIDIFNTGNFIDGTDNPIIQSSFQLNGKNRFQPRDGFFYNYLQPFYYFTNSPPDGVNTYSFSLDPENLQPSGTINLGQIQSKDLVINLGMYNNSYDAYFSTYFKSGQIRIFTVNYRMLAILQGQTYLR